MACRLSVWKRAQIVQRWWRMVKGANATIRPETTKNCHSKLMTTGSTKDAGRSGHPSTSWSKENVVTVWEMFTLAAQVNQHVRLLTKADSQGT
jgi:hypothetical protein